MRKLFASKEGTGRIKELVLNESSMPKELSGKKVNTPHQSLFLKRRSMILLLPIWNKHKMTFHHSTTGKKGRTSFKRRLTHLKKPLKPWSSGFPRHFKLYFIKLDYNSKDSHQVDVGPKEEELECY